MRQSHFCLAALLLAAAIAYCIPAGAPRVTTARAQQSPAEGTPAAPARTLAVSSPGPIPLPDPADAPALAAFVRNLQQAPPELGASLEEHEVRVPDAIRRACERILELERERPASPACRFAQRELLLFRMRDLAATARADVDDCRRIAADTEAILQDSERTTADAELATTLAATFEQFAPPDQARALYQSLGELFVRSTHETVAQRGEYLHGAARRLGIAGQPLELQGLTIEGQSLDLASFKGKVVLVHFWATWSGPCLDDLPDLKRYYQDYHDHGLEIIGVSVDQDREQLVSFVKKQQLPWSTLHDEAAGAEHPAVIRYGIATCPTSFLVDREGRVLAAGLRGRKLARRLAELCGSGEHQRRPYPVFNTGDVIQTMTRAGTQLYRDGKTRGDADLRKQLKRTTVGLELPERADEVLSDRDLYRRACEGVFIVCSLYKLDDADGWQTSLATAFAVTRDGVLATSCHVFDNDDQADAVVVMDRHRKVYPVTELLAANRKADTCLFRIAADNLEPLPLADDAPPGTRVRVLGHPGDSFYFLSSGVVANYERDPDGTIWLNTTADFGQGSSGGPVLDEYGNVVGQVSRTSTLYAGGPTRRSRPRRVAGATLPDKRTAGADLEPAADIADPQMVFKSCVPVRVMRSLVMPKKIASDR